MWGEEEVEAGSIGLCPYYIVFFPLWPHLALYYFLAERARMPNQKATEKPGVSPVGPPGRVRGALMVLRGEALVPDQIRAEWIEYQVTFSGLLERFGALLARQAKAQKKSLDEQLTEAPSPVATPIGDHKAQLRTKAARLHLGLGGAHQVVPSPSLPLEVLPPEEAS